MNAETGLEKLSEKKKTEWLQKLYNFKQKHAATLEKQTEAAVDTLVAVGTGAGIAVLDKAVSMVRKDGASAIFPKVSNPLLVGAAAKVAAFMGVGGQKANESLHTAGNVGLGIGTYLFTRELQILKAKGEGAQASGAAEDADEIRRGITGQG
jgi:hypothetical protein